MKGEIQRSDLADFEGDGAANQLLESFGFDFHMVGAR